MNDNDKNTFAIRMSRDMHKQLKSLSAMQNKSLSQFIEEVVKEKLERKGFAEGSVEKKQSIRKRRRK